MSPAHLRPFKILWITLQTNTREEFMLVDHVLDPVKMRKVRLRNPYVIKIRQESLLHLYGLKFQGVVNAEAKEEVINNHRANFTGCNDGLDNPTCGQILVNEEPIPFSQGFCCSCEDAQRAESFRSVAAKSNYYQRDDGANRARNRSVSSANLFDNLEAQRQVETRSRNEEHNRQVENNDALGRVTSRNTSAVNGPLGEQASPLRKQQEKEQLKNNSVRQSTRPLEGFPRENANRAETLPSVLTNVFSNPSPSKGKIEAYIDAVYEQAMKERAMKQAIKHESDKDLLDKNDLSAGSLGDLKDRFRKLDQQTLDRQTSDGQSSLYGSVTDNFQNTITTFTNIVDRGSNKLKSPQFSSQFLDHQSDSRALIQGSAVDDPSAKLTRLEGEQAFVKMGSKEDNREFLKLEKCDRSVNFSESGIHEEMARDRFRGAAHPENTFDYTPTSLAIHSSRIPEESQFSRRTSEKNAFSNGDNTLLDNGSISATTEFFIRPGISLKNDENINYGIALSTIESNSFEENIFALLSKIMISETRSSTEGEERQCEFRASENISDNVNALRNASIVRKNLSAAAIRRGNASSKERKTENANVSMRISTAPAFTRLQNLSSSNKISRLEELSVSTVAARSADKSLTKILESETRGSLPANEIQRFPFENLYKDRESYKMYNSPERAPKDVNLKNSYKFWKTRRKLRKGAEKFHGEKLKRFGKSDRGLMRKHALPDFKRDSLWNKFSKRDRRFRRHLQTGKKVFNIVDAHNRSNSLTDKASRYKTQGFIDYTRPETYSKQIPNTGGSKSPKKQMIFKSGHSHRKVQFEANDYPFYFNNKDGEKDSVDKRIEDKFMRISNVLKEDSTKEEDSTKIIQETPKNFKVVRKSEIAKADIPKIQDELEHNSLSRGNGRSDKPFMIHSDKPAELIDKYQGSTVNENSFTESTITSNEVTITSLIKQKDSTDYKGSVFLKLVIGPFLPSPITRKFNVSREVNFNESKNSIYATEFATRQTEVFTQKLLSDTSWNKNVNDYFEVTGDPLRTLSSSWENSSTETMSPEALNTRSEGERVETNNVRFFELNNNPPRIIAGNSMKPEGSPIDPMLSSRDSASVTEPEEISLSRKETDFYYTKEPLLENSESFLERSREKEEIAKLVDRIVRQYAVYTPIMPSMRTFDEITEAKTLPLEEETTVAQFTTTLVTTTKITDVAFRPSIRPLRTIPFLEEIHVEISLDETTFMEETEATTITHEMTVPKPKFQPGRPSVSTSFKTKTRRPSNKTEKNGKRRQEITNYVTSLKMMDAEKEEHPWYRTTEMQQIIAANRSEPIQKIKGGRKHRYKSVDYFQNTSSGWTSSTTVSSDVAQTRGKRSDFNRAAGNRDSLIFYDYDSEDEEAHRNGRTGLNKNGKSPNITELTELRSRIEKRLAGELDYPASRGFSRRSCENQDETQKLNAALQDIVGRNVRFRTVQDNLDSHVQEKKRDKRDNLKNFTVIKLKNDTVRKLDKDIYSRNCEITSASLGTSPAGPTKIPPLRTDLSGSVREKLEMDRRSEKAFGEGMEAEIDRIAVVRKIAVNVSENARTSRVSANDLSDRGAEPQEKSSAGGILPTCVRSLGYQDKSIRETDTVIRGVKLMIPNDKGESRELDVAAKSVDKKISPLFSNGLARQRGHEDTRKINENLADSRVSRVSAGEQYLRRPRRKVHDIVRKIINKIKGKSSSVSDKANTEKSLVESEKRAGRLDWHRSGRRLLSNRGSDYIENIDDVNDEYYANDESETDRENDSSDNEAIARRDDLLYLENPPDRGENRDPRKLVAKTDRLAYRNADVTRPMMQEERTVAAYDVAMLSNDMQANSEEAISSNYRNNKKKVENKNTKKSRDIKVVPESSDPANFNDDQMLEVPLEAEEKSIIQRTTNNNNSVQEKSFDNSKNILRNSRSYEEINEEPFSFPKNINKNYLRDESFYGTQPIFNTREIINSPTVNNHNLSNAGKISNDLLQDSAVSQNEGIKISLIGKIQIHGGFNQTPMLISFDAIPDGFSATQASVSTGLSDTIRAIETTVINLLNDSNVESQTFDLLSISESANDEASDSLNTITDESQEVGKTNVNQVPIKSPEKFFDLMERSKDEGKLAKKNPSRVEKRLDKHNANSRSPKQVFLTNYYKSNGKVDRTNGRVISGRTGGATDKLDSRSSANPVYFPDILGSVLVNNDSLKDQDSKEPRHRIDVPTIETNRSNPTDPNVTPHVVPLVHIGIEKPNVDLANDGKTKTVCCPCSDLWNASFGGCYKMPATVRKLEITETISRELQTSSNYRDDDHTETFPPKLYETTVNDQNAVTMKSSPSTQLQNGILEAAVKCTNETCSTMTPSESNKCDDKSINAIRVRNMMAIVRFMLKLLRVITEDEEPPCPIQTQIGETVIHVKNIINAPSYVERQKSATDRTVMKSGRTRQDLLTTEWRSTITERTREESSPLGDSTFESFTEAPSHPAASTLPTSSDKMFKDEELFTLFETSTRKEVYTSTLSSTISSVTFKPFLFYELGRKSLRKDASRKNTKVDLTGVKQNSNVSFKGSKDELEGNKSRLDGSQTNRSSSWPRDQIRSSVDRLHFGKQGVASVTNSEDKIQSFQKKYLARSKNTGFRRSESTGTANDTVRLTLPRDIDVSRNTLLDRIGAMRENRLEYSKSKRTRQAGISDRCAETRMKLLNRSMREGPPRDWIGEHRAATRRLSIDKKLRESRKVPGGTATPGKVVFRRVRGKINRPPDPNLVSGRSDSFKIEGNVVGNGPLAKLSTNDALSTVDGGLSSLKREDTSIRYSSTSSLTNNNIGIFRTDEEIVHKHISVPNKKRDVSERHDFWEGNHVLRNRQEASSPTRRKTKQRRKKKRKKGSQRTKVISETENQRRFRRHLLMMSLKPEYDADDATARFSRRYVATEKRNAENFRKSAGSNVRRRRGRDGSRTVDGSEADPSTAQIRGGQDCTDRRHPPNIDAAKYLESAHCLRFSDLWYSVYQLEDPIVDHAVYLQVYEKRVLANGSTYWKDLTGDSVVRLGTFNRHHRDSQDTIAFAYKEVKMLGREKDEIPNLDVVRDRLLVPSSVTSKGSEYPAEGESGEYLVIPASSINESGNECDKAGVGFAAFARQPDRCERVRGTCLKNQPLAYRRRDAEARAAGRPGCYFLSNFASVPSEPIKYSANGSGSHEFLALEYHSPHVSAIDIEIEASYNAALMEGPLGRISQVHVDSRALNHTVVTVVITNTGLTSMFYQSRIAKCSNNLPESWVNATFPRKLIQPRRDQSISLDLYGELPINEFHCSVQLLNRLGGLVATRRIKVRKMDHCSCVLHCLCVCVGDARGTGCKPMSPELYHAAGFRGPVPAASHKIFVVTVDILFFIVLSILLLLFMGFLKWSIGLYIPVVGRWGLDSLLETSGMSEYFERELKYKCMVMDEHGAPVHPDTRKRTVRICSRKAEFFLNAMFFFIFPFAICCIRLKKPFRRPAHRHCCSDGSKEISLMSDRSERPRTICVNTYGDSQDSRMEIEDTKYVIDELKKSEESLRSRIRSKRNSSTKEYRSRH
ncbi:PREDICTED: uncharacterized protein LOC108750405 [Trachymyrmex septentrionalis]|uniref:uncharacterized protein LOC108750405 n=1 Tax=Trachymyrmex septentrionalis TaxID=34720 RepID=UPI00084EF5AE|nr:PREDICTED: uncharacterized protein LOC108750405 [Trachymyrmex septentrionalis]